MTTILGENNKVGLQYLPLVLIGTMLLVIGKDLMHSSIRNYSFYLSESLLFGSFWSIFVPIILIGGKRIKWKPNPVLPFVLGLLHIALFSLFVYSVSALFFDHTFGFFRTFIDTVSENGMVCMFVYGAFSFNYINRSKSFGTAKVGKVSDKIKVSDHNGTVILDYRDILYIRAEKPYIALVTKERTYLHSGTLKKFLEERATLDFIQIHKSTIVNTAHITSYTSRKNGDYDVKLANRDCVRASRSFKSNFRSFFDGIGSA